MRYPEIGFYPGNFQVGAEVVSAPASCGSAKAVAAPVPGAVLGFASEGVIASSYT